MTYEVRVKGTYRIQHANGTLGPEVTVDKEVEVDVSVFDPEGKAVRRALEDVQDGIEKKALPCPCVP